ncbi:MAG: hypothetical protein WC307_06855 [Candidatus Nanoarchaeia archaeon]|jgi:hypothetical protein
MSEDLEQVPTELLDIDLISEELYQSILTEIKKQFPDFEYYDEIVISFKGVNT